MLCRAITTAGPADAALVSAAGFAAQDVAALRALAATAEAHLVEPSGGEWPS